MKEQSIRNREAIIKAINEGANTRKKIVDKTKLSYVVVNTYINKLIEEGIIDKGAIIDERKIERMKKKDESKQKVLEAVEQGASTYTEIMNITGLSRNTVKKHLSELKQEGIVDEKAIIGGRKIENGKRKEQSKQKVLEAVEQGAMTYREIVNITGLHGNTVRKYVDELEQDGTIDKGKIIDGRRKGQNKQKILRVVEQGASTYAEIVNITGLSISVVKKYVKELKQEGIIDKGAIIDVRKRQGKSKQKVLRAVEQGASTYAEIVNITGLSISVVKKYVKELKQEGIIDEKAIIDGRKIGNEKRKEQSKQKVLRVVEQGEVTYEEIVNITGLSRDTVKRHLDELIQEGIIDEKAIIDGRKIENGKRKEQNKQKILRAVEQGASTYAEIVNITGLHMNTVRRYVHELKQEGIIDKESIIDEKRKEQDKNRQKVLRAVEQGASTYAEIVNITGLHMNTVRRYVNELKQEGIIDENTIIDGRKMKKGKTSSKTKQKVVEDKIKAFDKKLRQNSVTATETLIFENLILDNSSTINANTVEMAIVGILKTCGKDGFKMACDFYDKCIELVDDDKARKMELQSKIKPYLELHKSRMAAAKMISKMLDKGGEGSLYDVASSTGLDITEVLKIKELLESQRRRAMQRKNTPTKKNGNSGQER